MTAQTATAAQHDFSKVTSLVGGVFSSLYNSIVFARLCEAEWAAQGRIDATALSRICKLSGMDQGPDVDVR
ncbi:MAG: hypothetical protein HKP56_13470 [Anderseniella sp.]|nr:hypothetical protein [Anderseniella sp.]